MCVNCACLIAPSGCILCFLPQSLCPCGGLAILKTDKGVEQTKPLCTVSTYCCVYFSTVVCGDEIDSPHRAPQVCAVLCVKCFGDDKRSKGGCNPGLCYNYSHNKIDDSKILPEPDGSGGGPSHNEEMTR